MIHFPFLPYYNYIFAILPGGGKKGVAIRPYPSPRPLPFIPNAFLMCEALTGFDSCWASSLTKESELGEDISKEISSPNSKSFFRDTAQYKSNAGRHLHC